MNVLPKLACHVRVIGGIAHATIGGGVVTPPGLADLGAQTVAALGGADALVFLADFRRSMWAMKTAQLDAFFDDADPAVLVPAALVVQEVYLPMFRSHAWNVAQGGIIRKVFTDPNAALRWCRMRADLHRLPQTVP